MKKIMMATALAAFCGAVMADGIESANVVGYNTQGWMDKGRYYMMGMQFETTSGGSVKLSEINFGDMTGPLWDAGDQFMSTAPQVQLAFPDSEGTTAYYFLADGNATYDGPGWVNAAGNHADPDVSAALGFWYRNTTSDAPSFTTAGQVKPGTLFEKTYNASFRMLVNPFPVATKLADIDFGDINSTAPAWDAGDNFMRTATQIQVPFANSEGFTPYYYLSDGNATYDGPGWVNAAGNNVDANTIVIPAGRGCWFKGNKALTVTFTK